jgi:ribosomal protein S12 methylthiotransferase
MVGFPGESEATSTRLSIFARSVRFDRLGGFVYSREEGTPHSIRSLL